MIQHRLAQRFSPVLAAEFVERLLVTVGRDIVRQWLVEIELAEVDVGDLAEMRETLRDLCFGACLAQAFFLLRFFLGFADDGGNQEEDLAGVWIAAARSHARPHVVAICLHAGDTLGVRDDRVGVLRGKLTAAGRTAGLRDHWLALHTWTGIERAAGLEIFAFEVHRVDLGGIDQDAVVAIGDDRARLPGCPETAADFHVFVGHLVAHVVFRHAGHAEVHRRVVGAAGDGVPADTAG